MHASTDIDELKKAIEELEYTVTNIWNIKQKLSKKSLPIFYIELKPNSENKNIYNIKTLLHCRVTFEPPRSKRIIQCANCQRYGHKKKFCNRQARNRQCQMC